MTVADSVTARNLETALATAASELGCSMSGEQKRLLLDYLGLLQRWNAVHNLSAADNATALLQHVIDCLAVVPSMERRFASTAIRALDAGTGGGLPAVVLSIMLPQWSVAAVDAAGKRAAFVRQVAGELRLRNLLPVHGRLEQLPASQNDLIVSRAFSSLRLFVEQTRHLLRADGVWAAMKGRVPEAEIGDLPADCQLFHVEPLTVPGLDAARCLIWIRRQSASAGQGGR